MLNSFQAPVWVHSLGVSQGFEVSLYADLGPPTSGASSILEYITPQFQATILRAPNLHPWALHANKLQLSM